MTSSPSLSLGTLDYHGCSLPLSSLSYLRPHQWLNDSLIHFYFEFLQHSATSPIEPYKISFPKIYFISPQTVFCILQWSDPDDIFDFFSDALSPSSALSFGDIVFLPINDNQNTQQVGGSHWSLAVMEVSEHGDLETYGVDSMGDVNRDVVKRLVEKMKIIVNEGKRKGKEIVQKKNNENNINKNNISSVTYHKWPGKCPSQSNSYDCGVFVCLFVREIATAVRKYYHEKEKEDEKGKGKGREGEDDRKEDASQNIMKLSSVVFRADLGKECGKFREEMTNFILESVEENHRQKSSKK